MRSLVGCTPNAAAQPHRGVEAKRMLPGVGCSALFGVGCPGTRPTPNLCSLRAVVDQVFLHHFWFERKHLWIVEIDDPTHPVDVGSVASNSTDIDCLEWDSFQFSIRCQLKNNWSVRPSILSTTLHEWVPHGIYREEWERRNREQDRRR